MIDFLNSFKSLVKLETIRTDNNVFKLHYKFTVILLLVFSLLLTSKQYFGDPIDCDCNFMDKQLMDTYCWIFGTYIIKKSLGDMVLPGAGPDNFRDPESISETPYWIKQLDPRTNDEIIWQKYYQWVCVVFCFQALLFYIPRYLWKTWEGGRLRLLVKDLKGPLVTPNWNHMIKRELVQCLLSGKYSHNLYAYRYAACEVLNFINVVTQILIMDWFLTGQFSYYGIAVARFRHINTMNQVFPKLTKCSYYRYGPSGGMERRDALCVLPLNVLNEKLFLVLWYWLYFLSFVSFISLFYRAFVMFVPRLRIYLLMAQARFIGQRQATLVVNELTYGDFFVLYHVGKNVNPIIFRELIAGIHDAMKVKNPYKGYGDIESLHA